MCSDTHSWLEKNHVTAGEAESAMDLTFQTDQKQEVKWMTAALERLPTNIVIGSALWLAQSLHTLLADQQVATGAFFQRRVAFHASRQP